MTFKKIFLRGLVIFCSLNLALIFITGVPTKILQVPEKDIYATFSPEPPLYGGSSKAIVPIFYSIVIRANWWLNLFTSFVVFIVSIVLLRRGIIAVKQHQNNKQTLLESPHN